MNSPDRDAMRLLLQAYADGELDPAAAIDMERCLASDPAARAQHEEILTLRRLVRAAAADDLPSDRLKARINAGRVPRRADRLGSWLAMAAAALIGAALASTTTFVALRPDRGEAVVERAVAGHIRGLLAAQPTDVASADRHTVKPWFASRLPESPQVVDLAAEGFALLGGRIDVIEGEPVATLVYRRDAHAISVTTLRKPIGAASASIAGYQVARWRAGDVTYVAVSDLPRAELDRFERAFKSGLSR